ncbi:MAG TPA: hypothetical protein VHW66_07105 [Stellaceae bacterium]|jgi:hypothetical protein|nr:hypothetical protein [Stellaceae bacterium]
MIPDFTVEDALRATRGALKGSRGALLRFPLGKAIRILLWAGPLTFLGLFVALMAFYQPQVGGKAIAILLLVGVPVIRRRYTQRKAREAQGKVEGLTVGRKLGIAAALTTFGLIAGAGAVGSDQSLTVDVPGLWAARKARLADVLARCVLKGADALAARDSNTDMRTIATVALDHCPVEEAVLRLHIVSSWPPTAPVYQEETLRSEERSIIACVARRGVAIRDHRAPDCDVPSGNPLDQ